MTTNPANFADRPVLITGCSSGIGLYTANALAARGYRVFATARKLADVEKLQASGLESLSLDLDQQSSIENAVAQVLDSTGGKLYGLFNLMRWSRHWKSAGQPLAIS